MQNKVSKIIGSNELPITIDITFNNESLKAKPVVIFCHGFKGFKDWGAWDLVANQFAEKDFIFLKFNFSHNGTTTKSLLDFDNLKAFSENNYSKELEDLQLVINWVNSDSFPIANKSKEIYLIGHSRGGGAVLIKSSEEKTICKTATWASIDSYNRFGTEGQIAKWKKEGQHVFVNGRTGQKMPIKYQFYSDYIQNRTRLDIQKSVETNLKPLLVVHGTKDPAVEFQSAENINSWSKNAMLLPIKNADHVFGSKHPFTEKKLPKDLAKVVNETIKFFS